MSWGKRVPQRLRGLLAAAICVCPAKRKPNSETDQQSNVFSSFFLLLVSRRKETQASEGTFRPGTKESRLYKKQQKTKKTTQKNGRGKGRFLMERRRNGTVNNKFLKKKEKVHRWSQTDKKKRCVTRVREVVWFLERVCDRLESFDWMLGARTRSDVSATVHRNEPGSDKASAREGPFRHFLETILEQRCAGCNYAYVCRPAGIAFFLFLFYPRCGEEGGERGLLLCVLFRLSGLALEEDPQTSCRSASTWKRATDSVVRD